MSWVVLYSRPRGQPRTAVLVAMNRRRASRAAEDSALRTAHKWNVSNVNRMDSMFDGARSFNQPLNDWNVSNVTDMLLMFSDANSLEGSID